MLRGNGAHCQTLRAKYEAKFSSPWPHCDSYLRELTREADSVPEVLMLMRECHQSLGALTVN